jgi:signal transduction histidine kinase
MIFENEGICIDPGLRDKIFEPYVSTKGTDSNFGLGLAISRKIILEHGGDIRVNDCSTGAQFIIEMPLNGEGYGKSVQNTLG